MSNSEILGNHRIVGIKHNKRQKLAHKKSNKKTSIKGKLKKLSRNNNNILICKRESIPPVQIQENTVESIGNEEVHNINEVYDVMEEFGLPRREAFEEASSGSLLTDPETPEEFEKVSLDNLIVNSNKVEKDYNMENVEISAVPPDDIKEQALEEWDLIEKSETIVAVPEKLGMPVAVLRSRSSFDSLDSNKATLRWIRNFL